MQLFTQTTQTIPSNMLIPNEPRLWDVPLHHWILCSSEVEYQIAKSKGLTILVETQIFPSTQVHRRNDMFHSLTDLKFTISFNRLMYSIRETSRRRKYTITEFKYYWTFFVVSYGDGITNVRWDFFLVPVVRTFVPLSKVVPKESFRLKLQWNIKRFSVE